MSKVSAFQFTNTTPSSHTVAPVQLNVVTNYGLTSESASSAVYTNKTAPIDAEENIRYTSRPIKDIKHTLNLANPSRIKGGIQYQIEIEDTLVTTDSDDPSFRIDDPVVAQLSIRHPKSGYITDDIIGQVCCRLMGAARRADGSWRFSDMMRGAEKPAEN